MPYDPHACFWLQNKEKDKVKRLERFLDKHVKKGLVLDLGCGTGYFTAYLNKKSLVVGVDKNKHTVRRAVKRYRVPFLVSDALNLPFKADVFDTVLCMFLLIQVFHMVKLMKQIKRVIKPKGMLIVVEPNAYNPYVLLKQTIIMGESCLFPFSISMVARKHEMKLVENLSVNMPFETFLSGYWPFKELGGTCVLVFENQKLFKKRRNKIYR
jgi:ubiquinone/menaquinone biosynthesis C-methylase UbiE